jgi:hypothetical protein
MTHVDPSALEPPRPASAPRTTTIVIYGTLALLAVAVPQSVENWLADMNGNPVEEAALHGAEVLRNLSERAGIAGVYRRGRDIFTAFSGVEPD